MKTVLIPTDFSENAWNAIQYAIQLFEKEECKFYILNAYQTGASNLVGRINKEHDTRLFRAIRDEALYNLSEVLKKSKSKSNIEKQEFKMLAIADSLINAIGRTVIEKNIDYIFMGTKGASGLKEVFIGSNTMKVIKEITFCSLIAVPEGYTFKKRNKIIFATGYEHLYEKYALLPMINIARLWDSKIIITHVKSKDEITSEQRVAKKILEKKLKGITYTIVEVANSTEIIASINKIIEEEENVGMVVILEYGHNLIEKITHKNIVKKWLFTPKYPC